MAESTWKSENINWPNLLTVLRIFMAIAMPFLILRTELWYQIVGGVVFTIAALTDLLDGMLARAYGQITTFGKISDPIADKLLTLGAFSMLSYLGMYPWWILVPILIREIGITVMRFYFLYHGEAIAAVKSGKQKTTLQITAISITYFNFLYQTHVVGPNSSDFINTVGTLFNGLMWVSLLAALAITVYSGYDFLRNNRHLLTSN